MAKEYSTHKGKSGGKYQFELSMLPGFIAFMFISIYAILEVLIEDNSYGLLHVYSYLTPFQKFLRLYIVHFPYLIPIALVLIIIGGILLWIRMRRWETHHKKVRYIGFVLFILSTVVLFLPDIIHIIFPHDFTFGGYAFSGAIYIADYNLTLRLPAIMSLFILFTAFLGTSLTLQSVGLRLRKVLSYIATAVMSSITLYALFFPYSVGYIIDAFHSPGTTFLTMVMELLNENVTILVLSLGHYRYGLPLSDFNFAYVFSFALILLSVSWFPILRRPEIPDNTNVQQKTVESEIIPDEVVIERDL